MKQVTDWNTVNISYDPLTLYRLTERTVLAQTEDQYPFATVYDQELSFFLFKQDNLSNLEWYERFTTKVDVGEAIGVGICGPIIIHSSLHGSRTRGTTTCVRQC
jgi:hypothetical protein